MPLYIKEKVKKILPHLNPLRWLKTIFHIIRHLPEYIRRFKTSFLEIISFMVLFLLYVFNVLLRVFLKIRFLPQKSRLALLKMSGKMNSLAAKFDAGHEVSMNRLELFELAFRNMSFKKSRTLITIGGMALGVGAIVFLVSIGYGLQRLVIQRVARLDELRQADVSVQPGSNVRLTDSSLLGFQDISEIEQVLPLIGLVAKVNYQGSVSDVAVYGVTTGYLESSAIKPSKGKLFESTELDLSFKVINPSERYKNLLADLEEHEGDVAGAQIENEVRGAVTYGDQLGDIKFSIFPQFWINVREGPSANSELIGVTRRVEGFQYGKEHWGSAYYPYDKGRVAKDSSGEWMGKWIKTKVYIWEEKECSVTDDISCEDGKYLRLRDEEGNYLQKEGYVAELDMAVSPLDFNKPEVLGVQTAEEAFAAAYGEVAAETTESTTSIDRSLIAELFGGEDADFNDEDLTFLEQLIETSASAGLVEVKRIPLPPNAQKEAVVNVAFLKVLGLEASNPIGKTFDASFIVTSDLLEEEGSKVESIPDAYTIVGVIPSDDTPFFYAPVNDLKGLGVTYYSQVKVVVDKPAALADARDKVEAMGFLTSSVADTVSQINRLFGTIRMVLALIGAVALGVAALGMFNTLTVSLLERTREVGLMKAMGMTSEEVKRLFLTESMIMGFMGGIVGILMGYIGGKMISLGLSVLGVLRGIGFIDIAHIPAAFVILVFFLSLIVGIVTGFYPAARAKKISALNALRYE